MGSGTAPSRAAGLMAVAWVGCLAAPPSAPPPEAADPDAGATLTVRRDSDLPISEDQPPTVDWIQIEPLCLVADITVDVDIDHSYRGDLVVSLAAPEGAEIVLADSDIEDDRRDLMGNFPRDIQPLESLDWFVGVEAQGTWTFTVEDEGPADSGWLNGWGLNLTCR